jgi:hypothetical protein
VKILKYIGYGLATAVLLVSVNACMKSPEVATSPTPTAATSPASEHAGGHGKKININNAILSQLDEIEAKLGIPALSGTIQDIVLTGEARDVDYMVKLGLMKGHLMVAKELLDLKKVSQAEPHIGHPVEEIYADVEEQLKERKVPEFKTPLISLLDLVKAGAKDIAKVNTNFSASMRSVDGAIAILPSTQRSSSKFALQIITGLLNTAKSEYKAAIADGKIAQVVEYQDSRGFVTYANQLYKAIEPQLKKDNPAVAKSIGTTLADLTKAWPTPVAPAAPVKTSDQVTKLIESIESDVQKISKSAA